MRYLADRRRTCAPNNIQRGVKPVVKAQGVRAAFNGIVGDGLKRRT